MASAEKKNALPQRAEEETPHDKALGREEERDAAKAEQNTT